MFPQLRTAGLPQQNVSMHCFSFCLNDFFFLNNETFWSLYQLQVLILLSRTNGSEKLQLTGTFKNLIIVQNKGSSITHTWKWRNNTAVCYFMIVDVCKYACLGRLSPHVQVWVFLSINISLSIFPNPLYFSGISSLKSHPGFISGQLLFGLTQCHWPPVHQESKSLL